MAELLFHNLDSEKVFTPKDEARYQDAVANEIEKSISRINAGIERLNRKRISEGLEEIPAIAELDAEQLADAKADAKRAIFDKYGLDEFYAKSHVDAGFFGHYRGTFANPKVVILADPHGYDSFITSKALSGERGQYLHGIMRDIGVGIDYLVLKTVPFGMQGASEAEWDVILERTQKYREDLFRAIDLESGPIMVVADGYGAGKALKSFLGAGNFVEIRRGKNVDTGITAAADQIAKNELFAVDEFPGLTGERVDIPREHLTWIARVWEGTSGDRVITADPSDTKNYGKAFAVIRRPKWARYNEVHFTQATRAGISALKELLAEAGEPQPGESLEEYLERRANCFSLTEYKTSRSRRKKPKCEVTFAADFPSEAVGQ